MKREGEKRFMKKLLAVAGVIIWYGEIHAQDFAHYDSVQNIMDRNFRAIGTNMINSDGTEMGPFVLEENKEAEELEVQTRQEPEARNNGRIIKKEEELSCP